MRLTAIEMQGFKSFPDKTRITFDSGVTAIIGPNGSGKSNISDAMRWVLGEMSVKSLRGSRMEDVIFNGTPSRPAANCASVSLAIDTEEEYNLAHSATLTESEALPAENGRMKLSDEPCVTVTRKYYRSGESEYYINKKQVRLKDVYELFYDTGIGREGYSVIGQGKISEVLSQKDEERRSIFEEAAGISKFRYKKLEAERKLRDTEANLIRVNDILSEISQRIGPLEKEAENAKQYLVLSEEKKGIEITLWLDRIDFLRKRRTECEQELFNAKQELAKAEAEAKKCDSDTDRMLDESYEFSLQLSGIEREKTSGVHLKGEVESRRAVCENDISHARETIAESEKAIASSESEALEAETEKENAQEEKNRIGQKLEAAEKEVSDAENSFESARQTGASAANASETAGLILEHLVAAKSGLLAAKAAAEASLEAKKAGARENGEKIAAGRERLAKLGEEKEKLAQALKEASDRKNGLEQEASQLNAKLSDSKKAEDALRESITEKKVALSALGQKRESLLRMEQLLEGYSDSVKRVINDCADGKISSSGGRIGLCGTVSGIISSDDRFVVALETALGAAVQFIVVEKESDAKACIAYLKQNRLGRATFLPLESVKGRTAETSEIKDMPGYIGKANELAEYDAKYSGIIDDLLGRTAVASDIEAASAIARKTGFRIKVVTLDGQVINPGGSYTGGSEAKRVGVFTRARDIERLGRELEDSESELKELNVRADMLASEKEKLSQKLGELGISSGELASRVGESEIALGRVNARIEEENSHIAALSSDDGSEKELENRLAALKSELAGAERSEKEASEAREARKAEYEIARKDEDNASEALGSARLRLYAVKNDISAIKEKLEACERRVTEEKARKALLIGNRDRAASVIAEREAEKLKLQTESESCDNAIAECEKKLASVLASRESKEKELADMRLKQKSAYAAKEETFRSVTECEMKSSAANGEYDSVSEKLWDEYELTYSDAVKFRLPSEKMDKAPSRLASLKSKIRAMGSINVNAVEEYRTTKERYDFLKTQTDDLNRTRASLDTTIAKLSSGMKETFLTCFEKINVEFDLVFRELFGGGSARAELTDPMMPLDCGIDIVLKVPGKSVRSISLLSGGEQSFAAISLYLALQKVNPAPFCIFDEIESALDDVNLAKFASYVRRNSDKTQYILITHRRGTMERADTLYGITMRQKGISDYMRLNMAKLDENIREYTE